jgi:SHS family lactate transporter-like MFS transporter
MAPPHPIARADAPLAPAIGPAGVAPRYRAAVTASFLGWTLDAFDFFLVGLSLTAIAHEFHRSDAAIALSITLTLAFRPLGAFVFGLMADRFGRRLPLMIDLVFFSAIEVLSGLAPTLTSFLILRALFGIGMGGEWGVGASLAMEHAPPARRGMLSGLLQQGYATGYLLAALCNLLVFPRWGWRPMFFVGGLPALLALFVRLRVPESEVWRRTRHADWGSLGRALLGQWRLFVTLMVFIAAMTLVSHGTQDLYPTFLQRAWGFGARGKSVITMISMVGAIVGGVVVGRLSDRIGRRRALLGALGGAVLMVPLWLYAPTAGLLAFGAFAMQFMVQGAWGVIPAHVTELTPDGVRGMVPGFAYQCGVMIASPITWAEALLAARIGYTATLALTGVTVCLVAGAFAWMQRERTGIRFGVPGASLERQPA